MAVNSFIAALGNILEGASSDRERTRKLKELEEDRQYTKLLQKQATETYDQGKKDAELRRAREQFAENELYKKLGYQPQSALEAELTSLGDPRKYELGAASFDLSNVARSPMDNLASKPVGPLRPSPFTGSRVGVIGQNPFSGTMAREMVEEAGKTEQRKETQRKLASLQQVPGGEFMYVTSAREQAAADELEAKGKAERALNVTRENARIASQLVEKQDREKLENQRRLWKAQGFTDAQMAYLEAGGDQDNTRLSSFQIQSLANDRAKLGSSTKAAEAEDAEVVELFANLKDDVAQYKAAFQASGIELRPGIKKTLTSNAYTQLVLRAKEIEDLGAITKSDSRLLEGILENPTTITAGFNNIANFGQYEHAVLAQLEQFENKVNLRRARHEESMGRKPMYISRVAYDQLSPVEKDEARVKGFAIRSGGMP